jgi:tRNA nucleotidyltransferase (CCA-adding enzyme)
VGIGYDEVLAITRQMAETLPDAMRDATNELPLHIRKNEIIQDILLPRLERYIKHALEVMNKSSNATSETKNFFDAL